MDLLLPASASTYAGDIDFIYYVILAITGIAFVVVEIGLLWFVFRYRARPGGRARYIHGSMRAEMIWTAVPAITVVALGIMSSRVWTEVKGRRSVPDGALAYDLTAQQFEWHFTHAGPDGRLDTPDDVQLRNQLHVPVHRPVLLRMQSEDVIHSFFVPAFRVKQDIVPGMVTQVWFEATQTGTYEIACAELCGLGHYRMGATVTVHSPDDFREWQAAQTPTTNGP
jgi:cytochrome c oxidase subunit 2